MIVTHLCKLLFGILLIGLMLVSVQRATAHDGHDHGAPPTPVSTTIAPRIDASSTMFELIGVLRDGKLTIFVDRFVTNDPVINAVIEVETPAGTVTAKPSAQGSYTLDAAWAAKAAKHDLIFTITAGADLDVLTGTLILPQSENVARIAGETSWVFGVALARGIRDRVAASDPSLPVVALIAFLGGLVMARRRQVKVATAIILAAAASLLAVNQSPALAESASSAKPVQASVDLAQRFADGAIFVPKATQRILAIRTVMTRSDAHRRAIVLPGRVIPDPGASGSVQASVSGRLSPPAGGFPRLGTPVKAGDTLGYVMPPLTQAESSENRQRTIELEQQAAVLRQRLARFRAARDLVARQQIEEAEIELKALENRRAALLTVKTTAEPLLAPVNGIIAAASASPGQVAETNAVIFQIVDPARLWIEALSFDASTGARNASARLGDNHVLALAYQGTGFADRSQAIPIHFAVSGETKGLRPGQLLTVLAESDESRTGIAVPRTSVLRAANGQSIVFEHSNAERFVAREVRTEPLDGERVLIVAGVEPGKRIVTQGSELLNQIR
jgi:membrane fusion protein, heavy metal efflux system